MARPKVQIKSFEPSITSADFFGKDEEVPAPPESSSWGRLILKLCTAERSKYELLRETNATSLSLEEKLEQVVLERDLKERYHAREMMQLQHTAEKQVRDAVNMLRKEIYLCDEKRKKAESRAAVSEMRRQEAEKKATILEHKIAELQLLHSQQESITHDEVQRVKTERDSSYSKTQSHAEERVKAMSSMAREAQDAMYKNMEHLEVERDRLTVRAQRQSSLGMVCGDLDGEKMNKPMSKLTSITGMRSTEG